jgi:hypothetical protein
MEQALCLLRPSLGQGELGKKITSLTKPLDQLVGKSSTPAKAALRPYLKEQEVPEDAVGGNIDGPIIEAVVGGAGEKKIAAAYFVIHDTASPKYPEGGIPADINQEAWRYNDVWTEGIYDPKGFPRQVNVIVNRLGYSRTYNDFSNRRPGVATQLEGAEGKFFLPALTSLAKNVFCTSKAWCRAKQAKGAITRATAPNRLHGWAV